MALGVTGEGDASHPTLVHVDLVFKVQESALNRQQVRPFAMRLVLDILSDILRTLWAHKLRSFLTMFGIAWGVGSLLLLVGLGEGFRSGNQRNFDEIGRDIMFVFPGRAPIIRGRQESGRWYKLAYNDYLDVAKASHVRLASPVLTRDDIRFCQRLYERQRSGARSPTAIPRGPLHSHSLRALAERDG